MLKIKLGVNLEVKLGVESKTGSKKFVLAFLKCTDGSVLAFLKCTDGSVLVSLKCMDGSVLAHLRFPMQFAPTKFPQSGNSEVPQLLCQKSTKMSFLKQNEFANIFMKLGSTCKQGILENNQSLHINIHALCIHHNVFIFLPQNFDRNSRTYVNEPCQQNVEGLIRRYSLS